MAKFGGNEFFGFSVPLVFEGRYFIMEKGDPPIISVLLEIEGKSFFEVLKNEPSENPLTNVSKTLGGKLTVAEKPNGKYLYAIRPGYETSVVIGKLDGKEISVKMSTTKIQVGGITLTNNKFDGNLAGIIVRPDGSVSIGAPIPQVVLSWLSS